jgi:hypothetical protein
MTLQFEKKDGVLPHDRILSFVNRELSRLKDGKWAITIDKPKRNNPQNRLFWAWVRMMANETGNDEREIYQYWGERYNPAGCTYRANGDFVSGGTSELKTNEFAAILDQIKADTAAEHGVKLPTMEDLRIESLIDTL